MVVIFSVPSTPIYAFPVFFLWVPCRQLPYPELPAPKKIVGIFFRAKPLSLVKAVIKAAIEREELP
jgi:hypothetical protein